VAGGAVFGEGGVVDGRAERVFRVARVADGGEPGEASGGSALVAVATLRGRVSADEREAVEMLAHFLERNLPALHAVAAFAVLAVLPAMDVGVAGAAGLADVGEHRLGVALRAPDAGVHAAQRVAGLIVIELGDVADGPPRGEGVAVLAAHGERAVRAARLGARDRAALLRGEGAPAQHQQRETDQRDAQGAPTSTECRHVHQPHECNRGTKPRAPCTFVSATRGHEPFTTAPLPWQVSQRVGVGL